jgi:hypothetical protein
MASPVKLYQKEMHGNLGFFATWFPGDPMEIGDAGVLEGGRFRRMASLKELGIEPEVSSGGSPQNLQYTSTEGTKVTLSAGAAATAVAKAEITVSFSKNGAFVFHVTGLRPERLENRAAVAEQIIDAYKKNKWNKEWLLVEALHSADSATIIVSEDTSAELVLAASATTPITGISLSDPKIGLTVASTRGKLVHIVGGKKVRPLYSCLRLKDPLFGATSLQPVRGVKTHGNEVPFDRIGVEELLES